MAWIESHESLPNHPKTKKLRRILKISPVESVGYLHFLWWWAMNHAQDGVLDRYEPEDIADACEWDGNALAFFNALCESGFIDKTETGYSIHNWYEYAGKLIELRKKDAERKRNTRGKTKETDGSPPDVPRTSTGHPEESDGDRAESIRDLNPNLNQDLDLNNKNSGYGGGNSPQNVFGMYESEFECKLTQSISEELINLELDYTEEWVKRAIKEAVIQGIKKLSYVRGTLKKWKSTGHQEPWTLEKGEQGNAKHEASVRPGQASSDDKSSKAIGWLPGRFNTGDNVIPMPNVSG